MQHRQRYSHNKAKKSALNTGIFHENFYLLIFVQSRQPGIPSLDTYLGYESYKPPDFNSYFSICGGPGLRLAKKSYAYITSINSPNQFIRLRTTYLLMFIL